MPLRSRDTAVSCEEMRASVIVRLRSLCAADFASCNLSNFTINRDLMKLFKDLYFVPCCPVIFSDGHYT